MHWSFVEIRTLELLPRRLVLKDYSKRGWTRPGTREYRFDLKDEMPPAVAVALVKRVGRPVQNGNPDPQSPSSAVIPARHRTAFGGTKSNGELRFGEDGINYVTENGSDSRSWRWADLRTLSNPQRYQLIVFGHMETYSFDLKQPMARELFDRLSDEVYAHNEEAQRSRAQGGQ